MFSISGHEDALDDFGIYEFVAFPDASGVARVRFLVAAYPRSSIMLQQRCKQPSFEHGGTAVQWLRCPQPY